MPGQQVCSLRQQPSQLVWLDLHCNKPPRATLSSRPLHGRRYLTFCSYTLQMVQLAVCCMAHVSRVRAYNMILRPGLRLLLG